MANGQDQNHEEVLEKMRKQLSIVGFEMERGYYNGDIKTRKAVQAVELKTEKIGLKRSDHLRELYKCLSKGETHQKAERTSSSSALSPEDLMMQSGIT